ncbi:MAG: ribosomal-protein-alanine N-acetyltransferase [Verrucomicrobiales bacterium]
MAEDSPALSTIVIREAELRDVHDIRAIDGGVYPTPWSEKLTIQQVTGEGRVHLVAEEAGRLIGHGGIVILDGDAHISTIAVDPSHQRRGIGDVLMKHLLGAAASSGCAAVTLEVRASNEAAIALYERHGLVSSGVRPGYYGDDGEDALIMWSTND